MAVTKRRARRLSLVPPNPEGKPRSGMYAKATPEKPMDANSSSHMRAARKLTDSELIAAGHPAAELQDEARTHYRVCRRCNQKKDVALFEGRKHCKECRERGYKNWQRTMTRYKAQGLGQKIPLDDLHKEKLMQTFHHACAFCGGERGTNLRFTRLISPRQGGGDEFFNLIVACVSCLQSRKGWGNWSEWYKSDPEIYSSIRFQRIMRHHNA